MTSARPLVISGLSVAFGGVRALNGVDLTIEEGELVGLVGPNGSGKSTLLNAAGSLLKGAQISGRVSVLGQRHGTPAFILAGAGLGRSFQDPRLLDDVTLMENLLCGTHTVLRHNWLSQILRPRAAKEEESVMHERALQLLSLVGLAEQAHDVVARKPYGTRKLTDIVRAFMSQPRLAFLDEPTSGLDAEDRGVVVRLLRSVRESSCTTMLLVEHHLDLLREVADRVVALSAGSVILAGSPREVFESEEFRNMLTGSARPAHRDAGFSHPSPVVTSSGDR